MEKKLWILLLVLMLTLTACNQTTNDESKNAPIQEDLDISGEDEDQEQVDDLEDENSEDENSDDDNDANDLVTDIPMELNDITIYSSNDDATAFVSEEVQIGALSPEEVMNVLINKGIMPSDVEILSFNRTMVDGKVSVEIDFNSAFSSYITSMGSTGEYYTIGSICNTFLEAYDCEQIKITVEGATLETGHTDYPGYMTTFS